MVILYGYFICQFNGEYTSYIYLYLILQLQLMDYVGAVASFKPSVGWWLHWGVRLVLYLQDGAPVR